MVQVEGTLITSRINYECCICLQLSRLENNQSIWEVDPTDGDYMLVDDLQKLTDEYVTEVNSTLAPKPLWKPFIESVFKDIDTLDLNRKDKVLIGDMEYLKEVALLLAASDEGELGKILQIVSKRNPENWKVHEKLEIFIII